MKLFILSLFTIFSIPFAFSSSEYQLSPQMGKVEFKTKGWPNLVNIKGEGEGLEGTLNEANNKISGKLSFNLSTLKTGIDLRDDHLKNKYLQVQQFPNTELELTNVVLPKDLKGNFEFKAQLNLHGVKKEITGQATLSSDEKNMKLTAEIPLTLTDFKIEIPSYQGITVADKVNIVIESKVTRKE